MKGPDTNGFSYFELVTTIAVVTIGLASVYGVMFRGMDHMRILSGRNYAVMAATSEMEIVKAIPVEELPRQYAGPFIGEVDLSPLADGKGTLKIEDHKDSSGRVRKVTATVEWKALGRDKSFSVSTLVGGQ